MYNSRGCEIPFDEDPLAEQRAAQTDARLRAESYAKIAAYFQRIVDGEVPDFTVSEKNEDGDFSVDGGDVVVCVRDWGAVDANFKNFSDYGVDFGISAHEGELPPRDLGALVLFDARTELLSVQRQIERFAEHVFFATDLAELDEKLAEVVEKYIDILRPVLEKFVEEGRYADARHMLDSIREHVAPLRSTVEKVRVLTNAEAMNLQELTVDDESPAS